MLVTGAYVIGNCCFLNGDALVANKYFPKRDLGAYQAATRWGLALVGSVLPLLQVMFTSRSGGKEASARSDQRILLGLYGVGLVLRRRNTDSAAPLLINIFCGSPTDDAGQANNSESAAMLIPYTVSIYYT